MHFSIRSGLLFSLLCGLSGCLYPHVSLQIPDQQASLQERYDAYQKLRPVARTDLYISSSGSPFGGRREETFAIHLSDGTVVYYTEDLLSVVSPDSVTAKWSQA